MSIKIPHRLKVNFLETKVNQVLMQGIGDRQILVRVVLRRILIRCRARVILRVIGDNHWFDNVQISDKFFNKHLVSVIFLNLKFIFE